ncbi:MAG: nucleotide exchange factor GrpE [Myxococcota bacterium]|jgi:molecular chaperone GrpE|nr:nucleotide exchange factor GrpE [Myxococcota bacterium]
MSDPNKPIDPDDEGLESIPASDELEAALREAEQAVDERQQERASAQDPPGAVNADSADKMTIELLSQELQNLKAEHEATLEKVGEESDKFLRLQAEFENFRRRTLKEKQDNFKYGHQNLVKDLLSTVDNLERAVAHGEENKDGDFQSLLQGVELVQKELLGGLAKHGMEKIEAAGMPFDPEFHEAMAQVPSADVPPNTVIDVLQTGYMIRDRMLRPARVVVSKAAEESQGETAGTDQ